jgi:hypothetical protein
MALTLLRGALTVQVLLGLARFLTPYAGLRIPEGIWRIHPLLGVTIAAAALWLFRPRPTVPATPARSGARFVALAPLGLGLAILAGGLAGFWVVLTHMVLGLATIKVIDIAVQQQRTAVPAQTEEEQQWQPL